MKKQKSAKVFKIIYFIISALWIAIWGTAFFVSLVQSNPLGDKIIAFITMLIPIPVYYVLKGFFAGSIKTINQLDKGPARLYFVINFIASLYLSHRFFQWDLLQAHCKSASIPSKCKEALLRDQGIKTYGFFDNSIFEMNFWIIFVIVFVALTIFYWILKWVVKGFKKNK